MVSKPPLVALKEVSVQLVALLDELEALEAQILAVDADSAALDLAIENARQRLVKLQAEHRATADRVVADLQKKLNS